MTPPTSICVLRFSAIGDTCNAVGVVQSIQDRYPGCRVTWVIGKVEASLLRGLPGIEFVVFDKGAGWRAYRDLRRQLKGRNFDALLLMQLSLRAGLASLAVSTNRRIGFDKGRSKEIHGLFVNERVAPANGRHVVDTFRQFAVAIGVPDRPLRWNMPVAPMDRDWAMQSLDPNARRHLVIVPSASNPNRNWLPDRYASVADYATKKGFAVYLCGGPDMRELALAKEIADRSTQKPTNIVGRTSLKQLFALVAAADIVLAPDTGPVHMAVATGTPVIGLYAHSDPARTGPYGRQDFVVDAYTPALRKQLGDKAGGAPWGFRLKAGDLMERITTQAVCDAFDRAVQELGD